MKKRNRIDFQDDERGIAIYARKSRITNKGDSIGVQFKQSAEYAINQMGLAQDYPFQHYEDKGLSGYYSDRPDFQRLLRDIEAGKIKAVVCCKLDRISRKTSDLMRLLEFLERFDVALLVCSNNINTRNSTSKIIIQVLAIIAEFERDTLTERVQDNLMELAKDGRWLGGMTPTGFASERISTGSGKNKSAVSFLVSIEEEKKLVQKIFDTLLSTRSICRTADIIGKEHNTILQLKQLIIQGRPVILRMVSAVKSQIVSQSLRTTFSKVAKTSLRNPILRSSFQICSMGFISGV